MNRTYVVTGAASGIGAATARYLRERGDRVIACDLHDADVIANLATGEGRAALIDGVTRLSGGRIDAIVANAGGGPPETMLSLNFFGAVATLEGLRPLLKNSPAPRAVMVSSIASLSPADPRIFAACLNMDEPAAIAAGRDAIAAGKGPLDLYGNAKYALNCWCRKVASKSDWAGAGIPLNVVAPGFIDTPAAAYILSDPERKAQAGRMVPMRGGLSRSSGGDGRHSCLVREPGEFADDGTSPFCRWWC
jgi:NAD(P)-dependent dehydrogenase (short-subunit alcohol dehydrogenase family)